MTRDPDQSPLKPELLHILLSLADQARHGYAIMKDVERSTEGRIRLRPSPLYRRLRRLLETGVIEEVEDPPGVEGDDERRRYYALTPAGRRLLAAEARRLTRVAADERIRRLAALDPGGEHA